MTHKIVRFMLKGLVMGGLTFWTASTEGSPLPKILVNKAPIVDGKQIGSVTLRIHPNSDSITLLSTEGETIELTLTPGSITIRPACLKVSLNKKLQPSGDIKFNRTIKEIRMNLNDLKRVIMEVIPVPVEVGAEDLYTLGLTLGWKVGRSIIDIVRSKPIIEISRE